jgi:dihydroorotase
MRPTHSRRRLAPTLLLDRAHRGQCTWEQIASWTSDAPARVWGIVGKGRIEVGYDADVVLVDPNMSKMIENEKQWTKTKWSPWNGVTLTGWPVRTWCGGKTVYQHGSVDTNSRGQRLTFDHARGGFWNTLDGIGT